MPTITLDDVIAEQQRLAAMIEAFKATTAEAEILVLSEASIEMRAGERYAGLVLKPDGSPSHHLILLPHKPAGELAWQAAVDWAATTGGELPTRREQSLLFANLKDEFEATWYWSSEEHTDGSSAWCQGFSTGYQIYDRKFPELQARAVRRFSA
jgi:hypothetical protein